MIARAGPRWLGAELTRRYAYARMLSFVPECSPLLELGIGDSGVFPMLELGCGDGGMFPFLSQFSDEVWGVELLPEMVETGKELGRRIMCAPMEDMADLPDGHFACVVSLHVMEHSYDLEAATREIVRVLRPGGHVCQATPVSLDREPAHLVQFDAQDWAEWHRQHGFEIVMQETEQLYVKQDHLVARRI